ncbi:MAG TPA: cyclic nucleotide-binding domain-containing protein [Pseudomonadales bacterium]
MSVPEQFVSKTLLQSFVPLAGLTAEQLDLLLAQSEGLHLFKGQTLVKAGDSQPLHLYLVHGSLRLVDDNNNEQRIEAGDAASWQPLAHHFPRRVTVLADSDCSVLKVDSEFLEKLLCWGQVSRCLLAEIAMNAHYDEDYFWIRKLLESKLFYKVPPMNIRKILRKFSEQRAGSGDVIIRQGEEGSCCFLLKSGRAEVRVNDQPVATLVAGTVFGEDALVTNKPRNATIVMQDDGVLLKLEKQDFYQLLMQPAVTMITAGNLQGFLQTGAQLLDVRTEAEYSLGHHPQAINLPLNLAYLKSRVLDREKRYITYSVSEERAKAAAFLLNEQGFEAYALQSGLHALPRDIADQFTAV